MTRTPCSRHGNPGCSEATPKAPTAHSARQGLFCRRGREKNKTNLKPQYCIVAIIFHNTGRWNNYRGFGSWNPNTDPQEREYTLNTLIHRPFLFSSELWSVFLWRNLRTLDTAATNGPQLYESCWLSARPVPSCRSSRDDKRLFF